jgi:hypothetical protein
MGRYISLVRRVYGYILKEKTPSALPRTKTPIIIPDFSATKTSLLAITSEYDSSIGPGGLPRRGMYIEYAFATQAVISSTSYCVASRISIVGIR